MSVEVENLADVPLPPANAFEGSDEKKTEPNQVTETNEDENEGDNNKLKTIVIESQDDEKVANVLQANTAEGFEAGTVDSSEISVAESHKINAERYVADTPKELKAETLEEVKECSAKEHTAVAAESETSTTQELEPDASGEPEAIDQAEQTDRIPVEKDSQIDGQKGFEGITHGTDNSCTYFLDDQGKVYSLDHNGYWYVQDDFGNYTHYDPSHGHGHLFPLNEKGFPTLPLNPHGEYTFPFDAHHMPVFPLDPISHLPIFPVDECDNPVFPVGPYGRPVVPVDHNGAPIFPRDGNGHFIFPVGPDGKTVAPLNIFGVAVLPIDNKGKPVIPRDASGKPLIHLASDGKTPLTDEEYHYSLQWNNYYAGYNQYYVNHTPAPPTPATPPIPPPHVNNDPLKQMKMLRKIRPEDIDLPPNDPPKTPPPPPEPPVKTNEEKPPTPPAKDLPDIAVKAKAKKLLEMQLKFARKKKPEVRQDEPKENIVSYGNEGKMESGKAESNLGSILEPSGMGETNLNISLPPTDAPNSYNEPSQMLQNGSHEEVKTSAVSHVFPPSPVPPPPIVAKEIEETKSSMEPLKKADIVEVMEERVNLQDEIAAKLKERVDSKKLLEQKKPFEFQRETLEAKEKQSNKRSRESRDSRERTKSSRKSHHSRPKKSQYHSNSEGESSRTRSSSCRKTSRRIDSELSEMSRAKAERSSRSKSLSVENKRKNRGSLSVLLSDEPPSKRRRTISNSSEESEKLSKEKKGLRKEKRSKKHKRSHRKHSKRNRDEINNSDGEKQDFEITDRKNSNETYGPTTFQDDKDVPDETADNSIDEADKKRRKKSKKEKKKKKKCSEGKLSGVEASSVEGLSERDLKNVSEKADDPGSSSLVAENSGSEEKPDAIISPAAKAKYEQSDDVGSFKDKDIFEMIDGKFMCGTIVLPHIKYTSNPEMQESFMKLKRDFNTSCRVNTSPSPSANVVEASTSSYDDESTTEPPKAVESEAILKMDRMEDEHDVSSDLLPLSKEDDMEEDFSLNSSIANKRPKKSKSRMDAINKSSLEDSVRINLDMDGFIDENLARRSEVRNPKKKDLLKKPEEQDDEEELCRLRYEALRSKTKRLMDDLRAERRRLKRERIRAIMAIRRAKGVNLEDTSGSMVVSESSGSSSSETSASAKDVGQAPETTLKKPLKG